VAKTSVAAGETTIGGPHVDPPGDAIGPTTALKPTTPSDRPKPKRQPPSRKILPGDLVCGECGEGNPPVRNFCSRCGTNLSQAEVARRRWWQRLVPRRRQRRMEAGARPWAEGKTAGKPRRRGGKLANVYAKVRPIVAGALLLAALLVGFSPDLRDRVTGRVGDAKDAVFSRLNPTYVPLSPVSIGATSFDVENPAELAIDGNTLTHWRALGSDPEPALTVRFDEPFDLERVKIWNGASEGFKDHARIETIHFVFDTGSTFDLVIDDLPDGKVYEIDGGDGIREADLFVRSTYRSLTGDDVTLTEIEFLFRR
jgi:hypothetical protein